MRVLCIKSSYSSDPTDIIVHKGCEYHVTKVIKDKFNPNENRWRFMG